MVASSSYGITNEIIITAMDRFVWFVLLVVSSHLVTEFTRVTGYARGSRTEVVLVNDSLLQPMSVQNMVLYPGHEYGLYKRPASPYTSHSDVNAIEPNAGYVVSNGGTPSVNGVGNPSVIHSAMTAWGSGSSSSSSNSNSVNNQQSFPYFSFRPVIDSIFEIPISTLRAVNTLVARLTGSYRQASPTSELLSSSKSASEISQKMRLPESNQNNRKQVASQVEAESIAITATTQDPTFQRTKRNLLPEVST